MEKAKEASRKEGISFSGDAGRGTFSVLGVKGNYKIEDIDIQENIYKYQEFSLSSPVFNDYLLKEI